MIVLDSNYSLVCVLSAAKTTTDMDFVISFASSSTSAFTESIVTGVTNGTTEVEMVAAPAAGTTKVIKSISIFNSDTATKTLTIKVKTGGTLRLIVKSDIAPNDTLTMGNDGQWKIFTNSYQEYGYLTLSAAQTTGIAATNPIKFDTIVGNLIYNTGTYISTLKAGVAYQLTAALDPSFTGATGYLDCYWWDITNGAALSKTTEVLSQTWTGHNASQCITACIVTPVTEITVDFRIQSVAALSGIYKTSSWAIINSLY